MLYAATTQLVSDDGVLFILFVLFCFGRVNVFLSLSCPHQRCKEPPDRNACEHKVNYAELLKAASSRSFPMMPCEKPHKVVCTD